jgi:hypothetical protein
MGQLPLPNNQTSLANAVAVDADIVYLMGSFGRWDPLQPHFVICPSCRDDVMQEAQAALS